MGPRLNSYTQNFDGLPAAGTDQWKSGQEYLQGWIVYRTQADSTALTANNGQANTGGLYSYGATNSTDRALGSLASAKQGQFTYNLSLQNNTGSTIQSLEVNYTGEQWRISNKTAPQHELSFWYAITTDPKSINTTPTNNKGWTEVRELTFYGPKFYLSGGPLNGNAPDNRAHLRHTLQIEVPAGHYLLLRWKDADEIESDHGLAIDDVTVTWHTQAAEVPAPLPVELTYFRASVKDSQVELQWQTASEDRNSHFDLERSQDGKSFEMVGTVAGKGTTAQTTTYSYQDHQPLPGTSYYRLKQVDEDESYTYSKVVAVSRKLTQELHVFPTIATQQLQVKSDVRMWQAIVSDTKGRKLLAQQLEPLASQHQIQVGHLEKGTYVLVLLDEKGKRYMKRFVKQ